MIKIENTVIKKQPKFWNHALFHPTDAVEDPWGKRILDRMSDDGAIKTIRIYSMFEDIVYTDENGNLCYDFRVSDLRLDYLLERAMIFLSLTAGCPIALLPPTPTKPAFPKTKRATKERCGILHRPRITLFGKRYAMNIPSIT